jgi:hypothetical protein
MLLVVLVLLHTDVDGTREQLMDVDKVMMEEGVGLHASWKMTIY